MTSAARTALVVAVVALSIGGVALWLVDPYQAPLPTMTCVVSDRSDSMDVAQACSFVVSASEQAIFAPSVAKGSRLFIYGTGDETTGFEPIQIGAYEIPTADKVTDGGEAVAVARKAMLRRIAADCEKVSALTQVSPIYVTIRRAMEQLSATGCGRTSICELHVRTEGEETYEPWLRAATLNGKMEPSGLPSALDNSHIAVTFCGLSETVRTVKPEKKGKSGKTEKDKGKGVLVNADLREAAWRKVFVRPNAVVFLPFCPRLDAEEKPTATIRGDANVSLR